MKNLKVCFVGIGSIATRHIANLTDICEKRGIGLQIDCVRHNRKPLSSEFDGKISNIYFSPDEVPNNYDAFFITNPTSMHLSALNLFFNKSNYFFIEKPICDMKQFDELPELSGKLQGKEIYIACPLRYTNVIKYIKENINLDSANSIRCISSSYLPDWRKGTDYRDTYSAHKDLGGGVSIDLIHEWDYIYYLLGKPKSVQSIIKKVSQLEIDSDDIAIYIADYGDKTVELHLDYFGRKTIRKIEIFTDDDTITGDIVTGKIIFEKSGRIVDLSEQRNDFQKRELEHFLDIIDGKTESTNDLQKSIDILKISGGAI